jgi:transcription elongation factor GreA
MEEVRKKIQAELAELENELRFKLPKEIQKAREFGDLKENAEYKAALERQKMVMARVVQLSQRLSEVESIDLSKIPTDSIAYGSKVVLYDLDTEEEITYRLVRRRSKSENAERLAQFRSKTIDDHTRPAKLMFKP